MTRRVEQADLFEARDAGPPGLDSVDGLIGADEEQALLAAAAAVPVTPFRFQGWTGKRLTASFGWHYDFEVGQVAATTPMPVWLTPLRDRVARWAGLAPDDFVQAMVTRYDPGAAIGWHRDRPLFEHVIGVSLGAAAVLRLRQRIEGGFERFALPIPPRSAYHLSGEARYGWEHSIAPLDATRWSLTFRTLSDKGRIATGDAAR